LEMLSEQEAVSLLEAILGRRRVGAKPRAAARLAGFCGHLPLALRIAAARLETEPARSLDSLAVELAEEHARLGGLTVEDDSFSVRATFASSQRVLPGPVARAFRLMSVHPGRTFTVHLAAAVTNHSLDAVCEIMAQLTAAHLIEEAGTGRYGYHDLIRLFAAELTLAAERREAEGRLLHWYLAVTGACARAVNPLHDFISPPDAFRRLPFLATDSRAGLDYLSAEAENLPLVVRYAATHDRPVEAWQLAFFLFPFYLSRTRPADFAKAAGLGLSCAERLGDLRVEAVMLNIAGVAATLSRRLDRAALLHRRQIARWRELAEPNREAGAWNNLAVAYSWDYRHEAALDAHQHALELARASGERVRAGIVLDNIGDAARDVGDLRLSENSLREALEIWRGAGNAQGEGQSLVGLAKTCWFNDDQAGALALFTEALQIQQRIGDSRLAAVSHRWIGRIRHAQGDLAAAARHVEQAVELSKEMHDAAKEAHALASLAAIRIDQGELGEAHELLRRARLLRAGVREPFEEGYLHHTMAVLAHRMGDETRARAHEAHAAQRFRDAGCIEARTMLGAISTASPAKHAEPLR